MPQVVLATFERLVGAENIVVVLLPHFIPLLSLASPLAANRVAMQGYSSSSVTPRQAALSSDRGREEPSCLPEGDAPEYWSLRGTIYQ